MIYDISHRTIYKYSLPVSIAHHALHLEPRACPRQRCRRSIISLDPIPSVCERDLDYFGNPVTFVTLQDQHSELTIHARCRIVLEPETPSVPPPDQTLSWDRVGERLHGPGAVNDGQVLQFSFDSPFTGFSHDIRGYALASFPPGRPILQGALDLTARLHADFAFDVRATTVSTPVDEVFRIRRGVCQDFAHLEIACLRALGLPARYVSGYLLTHPPEGQPKLTGVDASHAWLSVWVPDHGWIDLDPTNNMIPAHEHITLAWGRDYGDVSPTNGVIYGGGPHSVWVGVDVVPLDMDCDAEGPSDCVIDADDPKSPEAAVAVPAPETSADV